MDEPSSKWLEVFDAGDTAEKNFYNIIIVTSFLLFNVNALLVLPKIAPKSARKTPEQLWKWRNIANSLIHSVLSGFGALYNLLKSPGLMHELITTYTVFSLTTLSFSVGYFIYDFIDMATHHRRRSTYEILVHHSLVIICFSLAVTTTFYQGYALVSLLIEINSVFLHIRQLLIIQGWEKTNLFYKINSYFNLGTFVVFRLMNLVWMIWFLVKNQSCYSVAKILVSYAGKLGFVIRIICLFKIGHLRCTNGLTSITDSYSTLKPVYFNNECRMDFNKSFNKIKFCGVFQGTTFPFFSAFAILFVLVHSLKLFKKILIADGYVSHKNGRGSEIKSSGSQMSVSDK